MIKKTVLPSIIGAFPPASFYDFSDALAYAQQNQQCGAVLCPPDSFEKHYNDPARRRVKGF